MYIINEIQKKKKQWIEFNNTKKLEKADLEDIQIVISAKARCIGKENIYQNYIYGIAATLKEYAEVDLERRCNFVIEHGMYDGRPKYVFPPDIIHYAPIVTMGILRKEYLETEWEKKVYAIGPYIAYAKNFYSIERINAEKAKNGKTLLVFPSHSTDIEKSSYEMDEFIEEIERIKKKEKFNTIIVCIYWIDAQNFGWKKYLKKGYKVVCAGQGNDYKFLSRLRTIIELSDAMMMNEIGTQLGYGIYLGKPCYFYNQKCERIKSRSYSQQFMGCSDQYRQLQKIFNNDSFIIQHEQLELCEKIFGLAQVKNKDEIKKMIMSNSKM